MISGLLLPGVRTSGRRHGCCRRGRAWAKTSSTAGRGFDLRQMMGMFIHDPRLIIPNYAPARWRTSYLEGRRKRIACRITVSRRAGDVHTVITITDHFWELHHAGGGSMLPAAPADAATERKPEADFYVCAPENISAKFRMIGENARAEIQVDITGAGNGHRPTRRCGRSNNIPLTQGYIISRTGWNRSSPAGRSSAMPRPFSAPSTTPFSGHLNDRHLDTATSGGRSFYNKMAEDTAIFFAGAR